MARSRAAQDSRLVKVVLTVKGRHALETLRCDEQDVMATVFRRLPVAGRASIVAALEAVQAALEPDQASGDRCCAEPCPPSRLAR